MKYTGISPEALEDDSDASEERSERRCLSNLQERLPHWSCCMWFCIIVVSAMIISEVLAWLRQPVCGSANFNWNQVIPPYTVNQIERGNWGSMLQEYDVLGDLAWWALAWCFIRIQPIVWQQKPFTVGKQTWILKMTHWIQWHFPIQDMMMSIDFHGLFFRLHNFVDFPWDFAIHSKGLWTKLWHFDVYENASALTSSGTEQRTKVFRGPGGGSMCFGQSIRIRFSSIFNCPLIWVLQNWSQDHQIFDLDYCPIWPWSPCLAKSCLLKPFVEDWEPPGSWSNGHLLFGFLEKMAYVDETGPTKVVALEGRKMWGTIGSSFELWFLGKVGVFVRYQTKMLENHVKSLNLADGLSHSRAAASKSASFLSLGVEPVWVFSQKPVFYETFA